MRLSFIFSLTVILLFSCAPEESLEEPISDNEIINESPGDSDIAAVDEENSDSETDSEEKTAFIENISINGNHGDIKIVFTLNSNDSPKTVHIFYTGGCNKDYKKAITDKELTDIISGTYEITWYSWEQEAGCSGTAKILIVPENGEKLESEPFDLENNRENSGFASFPKTDQGISENEEIKYEEAKEILINDQGTDFVAARIDDNKYEVTALRGKIIFTRTNTNEGYKYNVVEIEGSNPIECQDYKAFSTYTEELARGSNPMNSIPPEGDYSSADDERLSFIEPENDCYPFGYEKIAAYFDHPNSGDFVINLKSYSHYAKGHPGTHGSLNTTQSRSPLIFWGKGIKKNNIIDEPVRHVDIAPTVAKLLGMPYVDGINEKGIYSHLNYLKWQDGHVIENVLDGETAKHVIIVVTDGLNKTELERQFNVVPENVAVLKKMKEEGSYSKYGSFTNWPSVTYPSHNTIGAGVYSGHHGLVDNNYYLRDEEKAVAPISQNVYTEQYFNSVYGEAETLHMAVHRAFGTWETGLEDGAYTMSIFDPSVAGSDTSDIELRDRSGKIVNFSTIVPEKDTPLPTAPISLMTVYGEQLTEAISLSQFKTLFESGPNPRPKYVIVNFMASDGIGHATGPHGQYLEEIEGHINDNVEVMMKWLTEWGILEETAFVFVSDHGMQIGDPQRTTVPRERLEENGIDIIADTGDMSIYFK